MASPKRKPAADEADRLPNGFAVAAESIRKDSQALVQIQARVGREQKPIESRDQRYYAENREKVRARQRRYYIANREAMLERQHKYYVENRERELERQRLFYFANRERILERTRAARAEARGRERPADASRATSVTGCAFVDDAITL
jgi:hypothetical protein